MKLPLRWLKEYVDYNVTKEEFVEKIMWRGFEIASIDPELPGVPAWSSERCSISKSTKTPII